VRSDEEWTDSEEEHHEIQVGFVEVIEDENLLQSDSKKSKKEGPAWKIEEDTEEIPREPAKPEEKKAYSAKKGFSSKPKAVPKIEAFPTLSDSV
jgi:uncharacterized caspase-like protein